VLLGFAVKVAQMRKFGEHRESEAKRLARASLGPRQDVFACESVRKNGRLDGERCFDATSTQRFD
jgi:hypothetical protein